MTEPTMLAYQAFAETIPDSATAQVAELLGLCLPEPIPDDFGQRVREKNRPFLLAAYDQTRMVGCKLGYERARGVFYSWLGGVHPDFRRQGIARELMRRQHDHCLQSGYESVVTETNNTFRSMLLLNIAQGFQIVGTYVNDRRELTIMMHKTLVASFDSM